MSQGNSLQTPTSIFDTTIRFKGSQPEFSFSLLQKETTSFHPPKIYLPHRFGLFKHKNPWPTEAFGTEYFYLEWVSCKRIKMPQRYFLYSALLFSQRAFAKLSPKLVSTYVQEKYRMLQKAIRKFAKHRQDF